ncbi:MAG: hypothetical protein HW391_649 [Chloroflexi bacterium]|nr:hypothetical protein [Chloroflexota bacterium]
MFAKANALARQFTFPIVVSFRQWNGHVDASVGAFIVLNADGWLVTAAHVFQIGSKAGSDAPKVAALTAQIAAVQADPNLMAGRKATEIQRLERTADPEWITNHSYWCGRDGVNLREVRMVVEADTAVARLDGVPADMIASLPMLKNPATELSPGRSLCRLGYAFPKVQTAFDASKNAFHVQGEMPLFPLEGMFTRIVDAGRTPDQKVAIRFIETSSPGLRGQSGGPLFDVQGRVWGIQSRTQHLPLGFNPEAEISGRKTQVPQFINLGLAVHVGTLIEILDGMGVEYEVSPD